MAFHVSQWFLLSTVAVVICFLHSFALGKSQEVPCYFIFGDSQDDNGNNNYLNTTAKANYPPYGIDFPEGSTGRFTNGRNHADFIAELLGFDSYMPPFANTKGWDITKGINYASGAAGILYQSGRHLGDLFSFNQQLHNHETLISRLVRVIGDRAATEEHLAKCLYTVAMGNNDYINNYWLPEYYPASRLYTPTQFANLLIKHYSQQLQTFYELGARKIAVFGLGLLGCIPAELSADGNCVDSLNKEVELFNDKLKPLVDELNAELKDAHFLFVNATSIDLSKSSTIAEIINGTAACCNVSTTVAAGQCIPGQIPCSNRSQYYFWDDFHPSELVNEAFSSVVFPTLSPLLGADPLPLAA